MRSTVADWHGPQKVTRIASEIASKQPLGRAELRVRGTLENGIAVLSCAFGVEFPLHMPKQHLSDELRAEYHAVRLEGGDASCVVALDVTASSAGVTRELYRLYQDVRDCGGSLVVIGYPREYLPLVSALSLDRLPGLTIQATTS